MNRSQVVLVSFEPRQPVPAPNLLPSGHIPQFQNAHPTRRPTRVANDHRLPLVFWSRQDIRAIPLTGNDLHLAESCHDRDEEERQDQQDTRHHRRRCLSSQPSFNHTARPSRCRRDQECASLRDCKRCRDPWERREIGPLLPHLFRHIPSWPSRHARLEIRGIVCLHDDAIALRNRKVRQEANHPGEHRRYRNTNSRPNRCKGVSQPCKRQRNHEDGPSNEMRSPRETLVDGHAVGPRRLLPGSTQD